MEISQNKKVTCGTCHIKGHTSRNKKFHPEVSVTTVLSDTSTILSEKLEKISISNNNSKSWYKISEIILKDFISCLEPIYTVLEKTNKSKPGSDPFLKSINISFGNLSEDNWKLLEEQRSFTKVLEMKMGDFHEELMGKFTGYETLKTGHPTGCDVRKLDDSEYFEIKNRENTITGGSSMIVVDKLVKVHNSGKKAVLVYINVWSPRLHLTGLPDYIEIWNGKKMYEYLSGRESFFNDLIDTLAYIFKHYKTYESLKKEIA
jgi:hypothetical protein